MFDGRRVQASELTLNLWCELAWDHGIAALGVLAVDLQRYAAVPTLLHLNHRTQRLPTTVFATSVFADAWLKDP